MGKDKATLFLLCGKISSGKSTLAKKLVSEKGAILINQDELLTALYPEEITTLEDYIKCFKRLAKAIEGLVSDILKNGVSVVLDFPANTLEVRKWMRHIIDSSSCHHELHFLDTPDIICLQRLDNRNKSGEHEYNVSEEEFNKFSSYFVAPSDEERFNLIIHSPKS